MRRTGLLEPTDIPALRHEDAQEEQAQGHGAANPSVEDKWRRLVQKSLVLLLRFVSLFIPKKQCRPAQ